MTDERALSKLPSSDGGGLVVARGWTWTRVGSASYGAVRQVRLASGAPDAPDLDTLMEPFDRLRELGCARRARKVSTSFLQAWVAAWPSTAWPTLPLAAPVDLPVALLPHQLSPALAVIRGRTTRLLLADAVGQGKTIEAGLILSELAARGAADRVLVLTPLTLRDQWRTELLSRCRLEADVIDRIALRARDRDTPSGLSPFQAPGIVLLSIDLAKQPDVLARLVPLCWDVLVIDEAHGVSGDSARTAAAAALGARARIVMLLTATPHAGDADSFARVCAIGRLDDEPPTMWFRHRPARNGEPVAEASAHLSETSRLKNARAPLRWATICGGWTSPTAPPRRSSRWSFANVRCRARRPWHPAFGTGWPGSTGTTRRSNNRACLSTTRRASQETTRSPRCCGRVGWLTCAARPRCWRPRFRQPSARPRAGAKCGRCDACCDAHASACWCSPSIATR